MAQFDLLKAAVQALGAGGARYMLTGSWASSLQGEPRSTHDVDLVVSLGPDSIRNLASSFPPPRYYFDEPSALEALRAGRLFQLLDSEEGDKIDFWPLTSEPFDKARFDRRRKTTVRGLELWVSTPEDTILMKLLWSRKSGGSDKQIHDARRIWQVQGPSLDASYLDKWARILDLASDLRKLTQT